MKRSDKVSRNADCPCGSGKKYKHCCAGTVDWENIFRTGADWHPFLTVRGRNLLFVSRLVEVLQLDAPGSIRSAREYKAAFTPAAVRRIHEAALECWPPALDIKETLRRAASDVSGLYIGDYGPQYIYRGIVRHSIYANKILVVDPFLYPLSVRDEYNPILNPEQYRTQTLKNVNFWFSLLPWIDAGLVEVIRTPADFDRRLNWESLGRQREKFEKSKELQAAADATVKEMMGRHAEREAYRLMILSAPDD